MEVKENLANEHPVKEESALYRLWLRAKKKLETAEEAEPAAQEAEQQQPVAAQEPVVEEPPEDFLLQLWERWKQERPGAPEYLPDEYWEGERSPEENGEQTTEEAEENVEGKSWAEKAAEVSYIKERQRYQKHLQQAARAYLLAEYPEGQKPPPEDALISIWVTQDKMQAWLFTVAPQNGGQEITREALSDVLYHMGVTYGIDDSMVERAAAGELYYKMVIIARGVPPVHGKDGELVDCIPRQRTVEVAENQDGTANYKNTSSIHNIAKGAVICKIVQPTEPVSGIDISGNKVEGRVGRPARVPQSANTEVTPDGSALVASQDGHIMFENDKFVVKTLLVINGDVDIAVGNLDFQGDIKISGDVREGYSVKAKGSVIITGMVEGASITAGKDITIEKGMNGNGRGVLDAQGEINCKFMENCTAYAKGKIRAGSIICSHIYCEDVLDVSMGKGVIIGGSCTVVKSVEARTIGSQSNRITTVVLGNTPNMLSQKVSLEEQLKSLRDVLDEINKTLAYMETRVTPLSHNQEIQLKKMRLKRPLLLIQEQQLVKQLEALLEQLGDVEHSRIKCDTLYPPARLTIGSSCLSVEEVHYKCNIYWSKGEIIIGTA